MGMRAATEGQKVHSTDAPGPPEARACSTFSPHGAESPAAQRLLPVTEALSPFLLRASQRRHPTPGLVSSRGHLAYGH